MPDSMIFLALLFLIASGIEEACESHNRKKTAKRKKNAEQRKGVRN